MIRGFLRPEDSVALYHAGHVQNSVQRNAREALVLLQSSCKVAMDLQPGESAREGIVHRANEFDIVVLAARGKQERKKSVNSGSISSFVLHNVAKPVLIARQTKHKSNRICVCLDTSPHSSKALDLLLTIVHPSTEVFLWSATDRETGALQAVHDEAKARLAQRLTSPTQVTSGVHVTADARNDVLRYADASGVSLIVCGTRGLGKVGRLVFGSFSTYLLEAAEDFSILVVP